MCGIAGILYFDKSPVHPGQLNGITTALAHRGPDAHGIWHSNGIGLGHRRLAVQDLHSRANQPMMTDDGRYIITYNGEIYNFRELRKELQGLGFSFRTNSDTEVVLNAFAAWGNECLKRFNGMFAFAIWDNKNNILFIARDRYGIKPIYYAFKNNKFLFGSEQKAILAYADISPELDIEGLLEYFTFQNILTNRTLLKDIHIFPAGCYAKLSFSSDKCQKLNAVRYWDFDFRQPEKVLDEQEYEEQFKFLFEQAVKRQLVSDVPIGCYLSGGIDSGSISCLAARIIPNIPTFTCGFDLHSVSGMELAFDERQRAEHMSFLFGTEHYEVVLKAGDMERVFPKLSWHIEEPRVGQSYPNFYIAGLASKFVKVVLAGTGGDELFGGYPWRYYKGLNGKEPSNFINKYYESWQRLIPNGNIRNTFLPIWNKVKHVDTRDIFRNVFGDRIQSCVHAVDCVNMSLYFEAKTFLHGLLVIEDKISMAYGLETRVPFLDNDLVNFAMQVPVELKVRNLSETLRLNENEFGPKTYNYFKRTGDGKYLLRKALSGYITPKVCNATKQGFSAPDASWFRGKSMEYVKKMILSRKASIYNYLNYDAIRPLVNLHLSGKQNFRLLIWSLLSFEHWIHNYLECNNI